MIWLPVTAYRLSAALGVVALAAAGASFLPGVLDGPAVSQGNLRGTALVVMVLAIPALFVGMTFTSRHSARALVVWLGSAAYIAYQGVLFLFGTPFNSLFLLYVAMLSLALWTLVVVVQSVDLPGFGARFDDRLPVRGIATYLFALVALNTLAWARIILPATFSDTPAAFLNGSGMTTNPVFVQDLAFWLPLTALGGRLLWLRRPWGMLIVGAMLVLFVLEGVGVAADQWFGVVADPHSRFASMPAVPMFLGLAAVGSIPLLLYFRHLRPERLPDGRGVPVTSRA